MSLVQRVRLQYYGTAIYGAGGIYDGNPSPKTLT